MWTITKSIFSFQHMTHKISSSPGFFENTTSFEIRDPNVFSVHSTIVFNLKINIDTEPHDQKQGKTVNMYGI